MIIISFRLSERTHKEKERETHTKIKKGKKKKGNNRSTVMYHITEEHDKCSLCYYTEWAIDEKGRR